MNATGARVYGRMMRTLPASLPAARLCVPAAVVDPGHPALIGGALDAEIQ